MDTKRKRKNQTTTTTTTKRSRPVSYQMAANGEAVQPYLSVTAFLLKGSPLGLRQFLVTESPLKMIKNAFYFTSKALFVFRIFKFLS